MFQRQKLTRSKSARTFKGPVAWLFGRQLIAGLKWIGMYAFVGDKLDSRDWMRPEVISRHGEAPEEEAFWFDYLADSGDGQCATYNIAYLCQHDLWLPNENSPPDRDQESKTVSLIGGGGNTFKLPRGEFLFVGGDTLIILPITRLLRRDFNGLLTGPMRISLDQRRVLKPGGRFMAYPATMIIMMPWMDLIANFSSPLIRNMHKIPKAPVLS